MGFSHRARASNDRSVRRWIRSSRRSAPLALSASGLIAGENDVKHTPSLRRAARGRKANPRKPVPGPEIAPEPALVHVGPQLSPGWSPVRVYRRSVAVGLLEAGCAGLAWAAAAG